MLADFRLMCMKCRWLPCSCVAGFTKQILSSNRKLHSFGGSQTFNKCDASVGNELKRVPHDRELSFSCQRFCCPFMFGYKNALPWHDASFPICHYSQHAPLPLAFYFRICPWAGQGTLESNTPGKLCSQVCFSQPAMLAGCFFTFYTHWEPGTTVSADVRIWLLGQLFGIRGNAFFLLLRNNIKHSICKIHFSLLNLPERWFRCVKYTSS